jgi:hypothetical protein
MAVDLVLARLHVGHVDEAGVGLAERDLADDALDVVLLAHDLIEDVVAPMFSSTVRV